MRLCVYKIMIPNGCENQNGQHGHQHVLEAPPFKSGYLKAHVGGGIAHVHCILAAVQKFHTDVETVCRTFTYCQYVII